jgi:hypothetical protein
MGLLPELSSCKELRAKFAILADSPKVGSHKQMEIPETTPR